VLAGAKTRGNARHRVTGDSIGIDCAPERVGFVRLGEVAAGDGAAAQLRLALDVARIFGNEVGSATQ
jgi:hypothetical protein